MTDLDLPEPLKVNKNIARELDKLEKEGKPIFPWSPIQPIEMLFNLFLIKKYKSNCVVLGKKYNSMSKIGLYLPPAKIKHTKQEKEEMNIEFSHISKQIIECIKKGSDTIIIPVFYNFRTSAHQNVLIYRKKLAQLEHFEPHGYAFIGNERLQESITNHLLLFTDILNLNLTSNGLQAVNFVEASQVCPYIQGLQGLEQISKLNSTKLDGGGYCAAWSMFFSELCLKNPEISSSEIMNNIYNYLTTKSSAEDYLLKVIRGYAGYIFETVNAYLEIFFKPKISVFDLIDIFEKQGPMDVKFLKIKRGLEILVNIESRALLDPDFNVKKELKEINKKYKEKMKDITIEQSKIAKHYYFPEIYYKKRILQNYEEYNKHGKITEPIFDSPDQIIREGIVNPDITKRVALQLKEKVKSEKVKSVKDKKSSPKTKTKRKNN